jgi:hypothetical protein
LNPCQAFPKTKMLKGRLLGIAQNVGDAFCFLILMQPESDSDCSPQVLARSVIRRRYTSDEPTVVERTRSPSTSFAIFKSDGVTPLDDWVPSSDADNQVGDFSSPIDDELALPAVSTAQNGHLSGVPKGMTEEEAFESGIVEVYGPLAKRPRFEHIPPLSDNTTHTLDNPSQIRDVHNSVVCSPDGEPVVSQLPPSLSHATVSTGNLCPDSAIVNDAGPLPSLTTPSAVDLLNDGSANGPNEDLLAKGDIHSVTQDDQDVEPATLDEIAHQLTRIAEDSSGDELFDSIQGHEWDQGVLQILVRWVTGDQSAIPFSTCKRDYPRETADYLLRHKVGSSNGRHTSGRYTRWARQFSRNYSRILRRLIRLPERGHFRISGTDGTSRYLHVPSTLPDGTRLIRRVVSKVNQQTKGLRKKRKPGRISHPLQEKYGVEIPRSVKHALEFDAQAGNTLWTDAIKKEVASLLALDCFTFHSPDYKPSSDYQWTKLSMIFEIKQDGRRKARLVAGGHMVDPMGVNSRSTVVKGISVRLLDLIAHRDNLPILCGDIGNAFITANCMEKIYTYAGPEFGEREGSLLVFKKALYGLRLLSRAFRTHFADFLRSLGFIATRYDRNVWMRAREEVDGYDYICTHVDDFKIVAREPERWQMHISAAVLLKSIGPPPPTIWATITISLQRKARGSSVVRRT